MGHADDLVDSPDLFASTKNIKNKHLSPDETSVSEMQVSPLQTPQAFRGARGSLFVTASGFGEDELDFQMEDEDSDFPPVLPRIGRPNNTLPSSHFERRRPALFLNMPIDLLLTYSGP